MKNSDIKYKTSRDYDKLYDLLKEGNIIIGFVGLAIEGINTVYSELSIFSYSEKTESFELGNIHILDIFGKENIIKVCEAFNVQYIPLN